MTDELTLSPPPGNEDLTARMETLLTQLSELTSQNHALQAQINEKRILDQMVDIAHFLKIPEGVITHDLPRYLSDLVLKDGKAVSRDDNEKDAMQVLKELQSKRTHWMPISCGATGCDPIRPARSSKNYAAEVDRQTQEWFDN